MLNQRWLARRGLEAAGFGSVTGEPEAPRGWARLASSHQFNPFPALGKAGTATWHLWRNVPGRAAARLPRAVKGGREFPPCEQTQRRCWAQGQALGPLGTGSSD